MYSGKVTTRMIGDLGEAAVCRYLRLRGWRIVARNFTVKGGEIDIVAKRFSRLAFVEVKTRKADTDREKYGRPADAVDHEKRTNLRYAATRYLSLHPTKAKPRFDIAEVTYTLREGKKPKLSLAYRKEAF